jgi:hypothetical protein
MTERAHHPPKALTFLKKVEVEEAEVEEAEDQTHPETLEAHQTQKDLQAAHHLRAPAHPLAVTSDQDTHVMVEMGDEMEN